MHMWHNSPTEMLMFCHSQAEFLNVNPVSPDGMNLVYCIMSNKLPALEL
jgi:hypothetical protein